MTDIFLSHSKQDALIARRIYRDLCAKGLTVWMDETGLPAGDPSWRRTIAAAIRGSRHFVALFSPAALGSEWVQKELEYAEAHEKRVIPVLIQGSEREAIPFGYLGAQRVDLRDPAHYRDAMQKLVQAVYESSGILFDSPTLPAALNKTLVNKPAPTRPSKMVIESRISALAPTKPSMKRRWLWVARFLRAPLKP
ncbi:MAG: toll/interleukin-1 receptor domain-containing protein [bacterium]|nr:toll/interleukin-1 receptor domain-containing protein [bacterium]